MDDVVSDHYQRRIDNGEIINNACSYSRASTESDGDGYFRGVLNSNGWWFTQSGAVTRLRMDMVAYYLGLPATVSQDTINQAIANLKQQSIANIAKTPFSFGEDVGEIRETLKYLKNPAASLAEVSKSFERKAKNLYHRYGNRAKALSGAWASHRFAMLPLQRSIEDIVKSSFVRNHKEFDAGSRLSARSKTVLNGETKKNTTVGYQTFSESRIDEIDLHCYILYETKNPLKGWQYRYGLRLRDIPTTGWQLIPYSFMVDRVANVSNCISGITNLSDPSIRILAAGIVTKALQQKATKLISDTYPGWSNTVSCETVTQRFFTYSRVPWDPTVSDTIPRIDFSGLVKDATSVMDLLALTTLRLKCL
jgi:hypothetical protein